MMRWSGDPRHPDVTRWESPGFFEVIFATLMIKNHYLNEVAVQSQLGFIKPERDKRALVKTRKKCSREVVQGNRNKNDEAMAP